MTMDASYAHDYMFYIWCTVVVIRRCHLHHDFWGSCWSLLRSL